MEDISEDEVQELGNQIFSAKTARANSANSEENSPIIQGKLFPNRRKKKEVEIADTGFSFSVVSESIVKDLGIKLINFSRK